MKNLDKEEFIKRAQQKHNEVDIDFSRAYDVVFDTLTSLVVEDGERVYVPKIGVIYRKSIPTNTRWMDNNEKDPSPRYKVLLSAKPIKVKEGLK